MLKEKNQKVDCKNIKETYQLAKTILEEIKRKKINILLLSGNLGSGKTTFCQEILRLSKAEGPFTSPTFVIIKNYPLKNHLNLFQTIYHIDCYRVEEKDLLDLGWKEIIADKKNLVLVEWPEKIQKIWPERYWKLNFQITGKNKRKITIEKQRENFFSAI